MNPNLDYMRSHRPSAPGKSTIRDVLPEPDYEDPVPDGGGTLDPLFSVQVLLRNSTGIAGTAPAEIPDPTQGGNGAGGQSINLGSQNISFRAPVLSLAGRAGSQLDLSLAFAVYGLGKTFWGASKLLGRAVTSLTDGYIALFDKPVGTLIPFQDKGEGLAAYLAAKRMRYSDIFDQRWMRLNCPPRRNR